MKKKLVIIVLVGLLFSVSAFSQWNLTGNSGTNPPTNFIGTTDNKDLVIKVNNTFAGFVGVIPSSCTSLGWRTLRDGLSTGTENAAFGAFALFSNTSGFKNTSVGNMTLFMNSTGNNNTAVGHGALNVNTTGNYNVAIGGSAAINNQTGSGITAIGNMAGIVDYSNATAIGYNTYVTAANQVRIGNSSVGSIGGNAGWTNWSDLRIKKNIKSNVPGLEFIKKLEPVTYTMDLDAIDKITGAPKRKEVDHVMDLIDKEAKEAKEKVVYTGFIAQDVEKAAKSLGFDFSGVDAPANEKSIYGLRYAEFVVPLVKAVQELSEQNLTLQNHVDNLTKLVNTLLDKEESKVVPSISSNTIPDAMLEQNIPNPFTSSATIAYTLPQSFNSAKIVITAMSGQEIRQFPISGAGAGSITISVGLLSSGMYYYSLYVDNMLVDTKRMIVK